MIQRIFMRAKSLYMRIQNFLFFYFIGKFDLPLTKPFLFFQDAAMILEEQPSKVSEAVKLFLQGLGYTTVRSLHTSRIRTAVSLAGTPVKKPQQPSSTTSNTSRPSIIEPQVSGEKVQQEPTAQTSDLLIGGLAELMLKEPLTTKPITK